MPADAGDSSAAILSLILRAPFRRPQELDSRKHLKRPHQWRAARSEGEIRENLEDLLDGAINIVPSARLRSLQRRLASINGIAEWIPNFLAG